MTDCVGQSPLGPNVLISFCFDVSLFVACASLRLLMGSEATSRAQSSACAPSLHLSFNRFWRNPQFGS